MAFIVTNIGEEHLTKNGLGVAIDFGLYNDSVDAISEGDDLGAITTEPNMANSYSRQTVTFAATEIGKYNGDWGIRETITFDVMTNTETGIDGVFGVVNFASEEANDGGSAADHLHSTDGPLSETYDLQEVDNLDVTVTVTVG